MSTLTETVAQSFPLERLSMRSRRREHVVAEPLLPYFIAGDENRFAAFVCRSDASLLGEANPILLVGPSGTGKTSLALHLATKLAISDSIEADQPWNGYLVASEFARIYADGVDAGDMDSLRRQIDETPVLVIDDLHTIADKSAAQEELAIRISTRVDNRKPTILTCRRLPSDVRGLRPSLVSRCLPGLTIPLRFPSQSTKRLMLAELALFHSLEVDSDVLDVLAMGLADEISIRELSGAIHQLELWSRMNDSPPTLAAVESILQTTLKPHDVSITTITQSVARYFRLKSADLRSESRRQNVVRARALAMFLARKITPLSLNQIGAEFGGRDHTTVLHAIRKTESLLESDATLRRAADEVSEKLST